MKYERGARILKESLNGVENESIQVPSTAMSDVAETLFTLARAIYTNLTITMVEVGQ